MSKQISQATVRQLLTAEQAGELFQLDAQRFYKDKDIPRYQTRDRGAVRFDEMELRAYFARPK